MVDCPNIEDLVFSPASIKAINDIKRIQKYSKMLSVALAVGQFATIFVGNDSLKSTYSFYSTDFEVMANSMLSVPAIELAELNKTIDLVLMRTNNYKEVLF